VEEDNGTGANAATEVLANNRQVKVVSVNFMASVAVAVAVAVAVVVITIVSGCCSWIKGSKTQFSCKNRML